MKTILKTIWVGVTLGFLVSFMVDLVKPTYIDNNAIDMKKALKSGGLILDK